LGDNQPDAAQNERSDDHGTGLSRHCRLPNRVAFLKDYRGWLANISHGSAIHRVAGQQGPKTAERFQGPSRSWLGTDHLFAVANNR